MHARAIRRSRSHFPRTLPSAGALSRRTFHSSPLALAASPTEEKPDSSVEDTINTLFAAQQEHTKLILKQKEDKDKVDKDKLRLDKDKEERARQDEEDAAEEAKPRRRGPGRPATRNLSNSPPLLPQDYAAANVWVPSHATPATPPPGLPPAHILHEALTSLLLCLHPQTQHRSLVPAPGGLSQVEPTLALYCPIEGGEYVIDDTVREIARRAGADVVVVDTAQLAAGAHGVFGQSAASLHFPNNPLHVPNTNAQSPPSQPASSSASSPSTPSSAFSSSAPEADESDGPFGNNTIQFSAATIPVATLHVTSGSTSSRLSAAQAHMRRFFDYVVNVDVDIEGEVSVPNRPRIIYLRDFPLLAASSSYWYPHFLAAVRSRRSGGPVPRITNAPPNPTVIVFGCTPPLLPQVHVSSPSGPGGRNAFLGILMNLMGRQQSNMRVEMYDEDDVRGRERRFRDRITGWERGESAWLGGELPAFAGSPPPAASGGGIRPEGNVGFVVNGGIISHGGDFLGPGSPEDDTSSGSGEGRSAPPYFRALTVLPAAREPPLETLARLARRREINVLAMRMAVGAVGGVLPELELDAEELETEEMWKEWGKRVEPWSVVRDIASRAVGGIVAEQVSAVSYAGWVTGSNSAMATSSGNNATLDPTPIPWSAVLDSWSAQRHAHAARKAWVESARVAHPLPSISPGSGENGELKEGLGEVEEDEAREDEVIERVRRSDDLDEGEQRLLGCIVDPTTMPTTFANVHLPTNTIDSIRTIVSLPLLYPQAFSQGILKQHAMTGALLFGVPGTGKTLVVRALARESGARMLMIKPSDIMDMYVGQSEKLVRSVFTLARRLSPCIVFLDEIDALFGARVSARESGGAIAHRQVITEFMQEMDGLRTKEGGVIVIGATNRPFDLDDAVLRRLPRRLFVDLPGEKEREEILKILLRDEVLAPDVDIKTLARRTEGFSGSDLKHACVAAALDAVKEGVVLPWTVVSSAPTTFTDDTVMLASPPQEAIAPQEPAEAPTIPDEEISSVPAVADLSPSLDGSDSVPPPPSQPAAAPPTTAAPRILRPHHFNKALSEITASTSESLGTLSDLRKWNEEFGEGGSKRGKRRQWGDKFGFNFRHHPSPAELGAPPPPVEGGGASGTQGP